MDLGQIGAAAVYGAIGGGLGALVGILLAGLFKSAKAAPTLKTLLPVGGAVIGIAVAQPLLSPVLGGFIGGASKSEEQVVEDAFEKGLAELRGEAMFAAILDREPGLVEEFRDFIRGVVATAPSAAEAQRQGFVLGEARLAARIVHYVQRGRDEDIVAFFTVTTDTVEHLSTSDPMFCHAYLYDPPSLAAMAPEALKAKLGEALNRRQQEAGARLVTNAHDEIPDYDAQTAKLQLNMAGMFLYQTLGEQRIGMVTAGAKPRSEDDARAVCAASGEMYRMLLNGDAPASAVRHMMLLSDGAG